jgi:hypothetical protein
MLLSPLLLYPLTIPIFTAASRHFVKLKNEFETVYTDATRNSAIKLLNPLLLSIVLTTLTYYLAHSCSVPSYRTHIHGGTRAIL